MSASVVVSICSSLNLLNPLLTEVMVSPVGVRSVLCRSVTVALSSVTSALDVPSGPYGGTLAAHGLTVVTVSVVYPGSWSWALAGCAVSPGAGGVSPPPAVMNPVARSCLGTHLLIREGSAVRHAVVTFPPYN